MTHAEARQRMALCREYKAEGHTNTEVAERFGISYDTAKRICRGIAPQTASGNNQYRKNTEEDKQAYVEAMLPLGFSYVGGYVDCEHRVTIRCKVCGNVFDKSMVSIRHKGKIICPLCAEHDKAEKENIKRKRREARDSARAEAKAEAERQKKEKAITVSCRVCGAVFVTQRPDRVCCSAMCSRKRSNRIASHRKDKRIAKDKRIDKGITAAELYRRDGGVCWICGGRCDTEDYIVRDGAIICGDSYPSIDHIVAVADGGADSWGNVRLAHRICNTRRYWKEFHAPPQNLCTPHHG